MVMQKAYTVWKCKLTAIEYEDQNDSCLRKKDGFLLPKGLANQLYGVFFDSFNVNIQWEYLVNM